MPPLLPPFAKENAAVTVTVEKETVSPLHLGHGCELGDAFLSAKQTEEFIGRNMDGGLVKWENAKEPLLHQKHYILKQYHTLFAEKHK
ncbi:unnamed protein product [Musa banksii]